MEKYGKIDAMYLSTNTILIIIQHISTSPFKKLLKVENSQSSSYKLLKHGFPNEWIINHCRMIIFNDNLLINQFFY